MRRRIFVGGIGGTLALPAAVAAEPTPTLGMLSTGGVDVLTRAFFKGLSDGGFVEGKNLNVVRRSAEGQSDRLPGLAGELVAEKVSVIFASGGPGPTRAAKTATASIPIVFAFGGDPVGEGLVPSISRPGGNVTGATFLGASFTAKRLELLKQLLPRAVDVAVMLNPKSTLTEVQRRDANAAVKVLGQKLHVLNAGSGEEIDAAFAAIDREKIGALLVGTDPGYGLVFRDRIVALAARYRIPAMYDARDFIEKGGLISYGSILTDTWRQAGLYVGRILKGEKPADLPVVQPTRFETLVNLRTARMLGLDVPATVLALADDTVD